MVEGDLFAQPVDAIVNPWNRNVLPWWLLLPTGVAGALRKQAGNQPFRELGRKGRLEPGAAVDTSAGRLPFQRIIHVACIGTRSNSSAELVRLSAANAVALAERLGLRSLAFPLLGAGAGSLDPRSAEATLLNSLEPLSSGLRALVVRYRESSPEPV